MLNYKKIRNRYLYILALALFGLSRIACAQTFPIDTNRIYMLEETTIEGKKSSFHVVSPAPVQILNGDRLHRLGGLSVADAVRHFSGTQLKDYGGIGGMKTLNVRSLGSNHTTVFYDGMPLGNAQNGQVDLGKFSLHNLEEIRLFNGQHPTIFQSARAFFSSAVLQLKTQQPAFNTGKKQQGKISLKGGSFGLVNPSLQWQQQWSEKIAWSADLDYTDADGEYKFRLTNGVYDTTLHRKNGDIRSFRGETNFFLTTGVGRLRAKAYFYHSERGLPGAILANRYTSAQRQKDQTFLAHISFESKTGRRYRWMTDLKYSHDYTRYEDPEHKLTTGHLINTFYQDELYLSTVHLWALNDWCDLSFSSDLSWQSLDANLHRFVYPSRYSWWNALSANIERERLIIQGNLLLLTTSDKNKNDDKRSSRTEFCPVVMLSWQPFAGELLHLRAFWKRSFRMPTFNDLYYTYSGNSDLRPEFTWQYNGGISWMHRPNNIIREIALQVDCYYNQVHDKILAIPSANLFRWTMVNLGKVEITGLEPSLRIDWSCGRGFDFQAGLNYTWQRAKDITPDSGSYGHDIPYAPRHTASAHLLCDYRGWNLNYSLIYTGKRNIDYTPRGKLPAWNTSDLGISYQLNLRQQSWQIGMDINNLFDKQYQVVSNYPMPGRSWKIKIAYSIQHAASNGQRAVKK